VFAVCLRPQLFPHRENAKTGAGNRTNPLKNIPRFQQAVLPLVGLDLQLANLNPYDLPVNVAFQQQFFFALTQLG
jgi:hypothetical protein